MVKKYRVELTEGERGELKALVSQGRAAAYKQTHARILLLSDENWGEGPLKDLEIARVLQVGTATVERVRRRCVEAGVEAALSRRQQLKRRPKKLDGSGEAHPVSSTGQALNSHHPASLYEAFEPAEAQRIAQRLEIHYTPKHGSWLNPVLSRSKGWPRSNWGCWPGSAWTAGYPVGKSWNGKPMPGSNGATRRASGQTGASLPRACPRPRPGDARIKLKSLYPSLQ